MSYNKSLPSYEPLFVRLRPLLLPPLFLRRPSMSQRLNLSGLHRPLNLLLPRTMPQDRLTMLARHKPLRTPNPCKM